MTQEITRIALVAVFSGVAFGQPADAPARFEIADVHVGGGGRFMTMIPPRAGRYEFHDASIADLISIAYGYEPGKVVGGPSWLEIRRFDVIAKAPAGTKQEAEPGDALKEMLQALLADRFKLVLHKDMRPLPGYALTRGKKPLMQAADGLGDTGCRLLPETDRYFRYACRNIGMDDFAAGLTRMRGSTLPGASPVVNKTGLDGRWNFDVKWSQLEGVTTADAIDQQLGLKLEPQQVPTPVMVVDSVNEQPTANPPGVAEALPIAPQPAAYESAVFKPTDPDSPAPKSFTSQPGGRSVVHTAPLSELIILAFKPPTGAAPVDLVTGVPDWAQTERFDITAKAPSGYADTGMMLRSLLEERVKLKWHTEERPVSAYTLLAPKPKMKKADPASRSHCVSSTAPAGSPPGSTFLSCQNTTMAQLALHLQIQYRGPGQSWPILDATGIEGGWDFTLIFNKRGPVGAANSTGEPPPSGASGPTLSDPSGDITIIEAVEKQLGLKMELRKRPMPVIVIDHVERKPSDN